MKEFDEVFAIVVQIGSTIKSTAAVGKCYRNSNPMPT